MSDKENEPVFDAAALKRLIRIMNSVLNIYDVSGIPNEISDMLFEPVGKLAKILNIPYKLAPTKEGESEADIQKYIMPDDFEEWFETNGNKRVVKS